MILNLVPYQHAKLVKVGADSPRNTTRLLTGWNESKWEGSVEEAKRIALAEIHEHAGGSSAAYAFTKALFDYFKNK